MAHLSPDTFIDLLDGTVAETSMPHLARCARCREQLAGLRQAWQVAVAADDLPEPSPLFWDHFSARVHEAVAAEASRPSRWWRLDWSWRVAGLAGAAVAVLAVVVALQLPRHGADPAAPLRPPNLVSTAPVAVEAEPPADDESLGFVVDLASNIDWDTADEQGLASHGDADWALTYMNEAERVELQRLLNEALSANRRM